MKLSTRARYGLRALVDIGLYSENETVPIQSIADRQNISVGYLEQLVAMLKKAGLVESTRGAYGGYRLARPADEISVGEVLRILEGSLDAVSCPGMEAEQSCEGSGTCVTKYVWRRINDSICEAVDHLSLRELIDESREANQQAGSTCPKGTPCNS